MKKFVICLLLLSLTAGILMLSGCGGTVDPGTPPPDVINPGSTTNSADDESANNPGESSVEPSENPAQSSPDTWDILEDTVSIRIGRNGQTEFYIDMYDNTAVSTMLNYLTSSSLLFPAYSYSDEQSFVGQSVRGSYTRDDETTVTDIKAGELYLFSGGQLRLYFRDVAGANITATPVGYLTDATEITDTVVSAYESNRNDTWGVDVYFWITKH